MPSREPELYKDKIEVSLDGRQIFYLFFGGAVIVGLVFVLGVMVGRRVESRGHLDRADTQTASDPLAALDRLERTDNLSFHGVLTGSAPASDVDKAIGELEKRRAAGKTDKKDAAKAAVSSSDAKPAGLETKPEARNDAKPEAKNDARPDAKPEAKNDAKNDAKSEAKNDARSETKNDAKSEAKNDAKPDKLDARPEPVVKPDADKPRSDPDKTRSDKHDGDRKSKHHDDSRTDKPVTRPDARADAKPDSRSDDRRDARSDGDAKTASDAKVRLTLQLSSFQDKSEAEAFLTAMKSAGFQPYLTEADVRSKGTFYRVRLGSFRSLEAANDAKADYEKTSKKTAQIMPF
jgi:DedD protein